MGCKKSTYFDRINFPVSSINLEIVIPCVNPKFIFTHLTNFSPCEKVPQPFWGCCLYSL